MSVKQMSLVWELDLAPNKRLVLLAYADHADEDGENVYPSLPKVARKTGYGKDQVRRITRQLEQDGLMEKVEEGVGRGNTHRYKLTLEKGSKLPPFEPKREKVASEEKVAPQTEKVASEPVKGGIAMQPEPPERTIKEPSEKNDSSSNDSESADEPPPQKISKPQDLKQFAVAELMKRVSSARARGAPIHDPLDRDRAQYARFFATRAKVHDVDTLLYVFDYMVAKASGEIEGEPKAWCGFDTALDRVLEGWRPTRRFMDEEERRRAEEEVRAAEAELWETVRDVVEREEAEKAAAEKPSPEDIKRMFREAMAEVGGRSL